jgi:hypothetical protein
MKYIWTKAQAWGYPCHPKKYPRSTSVKAWGCPKAPLIHRQKSGHLSRYYIFIASYSMRLERLYFRFWFSFVLFAAINGWITSCLFRRETRSVFIAKNTLVFTLFVQRVFSFSLVISLYQGVFRPLVYDGFHLKEWFQKG